MDNYKFSTKYIRILAVALFLTILVTVIITVLFTIQLFNGNPYNMNIVIIGGIFIGTLSGFGLVVLFSPFYFKAFKRLGDRLLWEQKDVGMLLPITDEMINRINSLENEEIGDRLWQVLEYDWLESVDKVRRELEGRESGG